MGDERPDARQRVLLRRGARLRRAQAQLAALRRTNRRLLARSPRAVAAEGLIRPGSVPGSAPPAAHPSAHRASPQAAGLRAGILDLDRETNVALVAGPGGERRAALTPSEARVLALLMERPGHVWSCRDLARLALGYDVVDAEAVELVRPHISRLRQKLEPDPLQPHPIRTVRGRGYLLSP